MTPMYDSVRWGVPVRGTLILSRRHSKVGWPVPFLSAFNFPSVATRYPFAAEWTVSEHPNYDPRVRLEPLIFCSSVRHSNLLATRPCSAYYVVILNFYGLAFNLVKSCLQDFLGKSDPYLEISRANEDGSFTVVHKSEVCRLDLNIIFQFL